MTSARDFPDWIGPMLVKELRQGLKGRAFEWSFVALQVLLLLVMAYHAVLYARHRQEFEASGLNTIFWLMLYLQLLVVTPLRALGALVNERKANTLELIFMTGLSSWRIAFGKWLSMFSQGMLFLLAVLPYAILRYFFGGVNLTEDLAALLLLVLSCAGLTAIAVAVSGMPVFIRIAAMCIVGLSGFWIVSGFAMFLMMQVFGGRSGFSMGTFIGPGLSDVPWAAAVYNSALLTVAALEVAATSVAPPAENHAMRQRLITIAAWLPIPLMVWMEVQEELLIAQVIFFAALAFLTAWQNLSVHPEPLRPHVEPFARRGMLGFVVGAFLQPGWPGAVLFLAVVEALLVASARWITRNADSRAEFLMVMLMIGAALLTPPLLWRIFRPKGARWPLVGQSIFLALCGAAAAFFQGLKPNGAPGMGENPFFVLLPPLGLWMLADYRGNHWAHMWVKLGASAFIVCAVALLLLALPYWKRLLQLHREIRRTKPAPAPQLAPAT